MIKPMSHWDVLEKNPPGRRWETSNWPNWITGCWKGEVSFPGSGFPGFLVQERLKRRVFKDGLFVGWSKMWFQCWHKPLRFWVLDGTDFLEHELIDLLSALSPWVTSNMMKQISAILYNSYIFNGLAVCVCFLNSQLNLEISQFHWASRRERPSDWEPLCLGDSTHRQMQQTNGA